MNDLELGPPRVTGMLVLAAVLVAVVLPPVLLAAVLVLGLLPVLAAARLESFPIIRRATPPPPRPRLARAPPRS